MNKQYLEKELMRMSKSDLQKLCKYFGIAVTKQKGGYYRKNEIIGNLVGGAGLVHDLNAKIIPIPYIRELSDAKSFNDHSNKICIEKFRKSKNLSELADVIFEEPLLAHGANTSDSESTHENYVKNYKIQCKGNFVSPHRPISNYYNSMKKMLPPSNHLYDNPIHGNPIHGNHFVNEKTGWLGINSNINKFITRILYPDDLSVPTIMVSHGQFMRELRNRLVNTIGWEAEYIFLGIPKTVNSFLVNNDSARADWVNIRTAICNNLIKNVWAHIFNDKSLLSKKPTATGKVFPIPDDKSFANSDIEDGLLTQLGDDLYNKWKDKVYNELLKKKIDKGYGGNGAILRITHTKGKSMRIWYLVRHLYSWANNEQENSNLGVSRGWFKRDSILHKSASGDNGIKLWRMLLDTCKDDTYKHYAAIIDFEQKLSNIATLTTDDKIGVSTLRRTSETAFLLLQNAAQSQTS